MLNSVALDVRAACIFQMTIAFFCVWISIIKRILSSLLISPGKTCLLVTLPKEKGFVDIVVQTTKLGRTLLWSEFCQIYTFYKID